MLYRKLEIGEGVSAVDEVVNLGLHVSRYTSAVHVGPLRGTKSH